jgi:hypothetical protein
VSAFGGRTAVNVRIKEKMKRLQILFVITVLATSTFATHQNPDRIFIENDTFFVYSDLFKNHIRKDSIFKNIYKQVEDLEMTLNPEADEFEVRQVYGIWEIVENRLFLIKMTEGVHNIDLDELFKEKESKGRVFADWLTDTIYISKGEILSVGASPIREYETKLILQNGVVTGRTDYTNQILKKSDFLTDNEFIYKHINWDSIPDLNEQTVQVYIQIQPMDNGKLNYIDNDSFAIIDNEFISDKENPFIEEAIRIARLVPEWTVVIQRDKITPQLMTINFDQRLKNKYTR